MDERFRVAYDAYREQILIPIGSLATQHPFAAMTLGCCALDFLANIKRNGNLMRTVERDLDGYSDPAVAEAVVELRNGLVHEFRTLHLESREHIALSGDLEQPWKRFPSGLVVSVPHFCKAIRAAFDRVAATEDVGLKRAFIDKAAIRVTLLTEAHLAWPDTAPSIRDTSSFASPAASGTGGPFPHLADSRMYGFMRDEG